MLFLPMQPVTKLHLTTEIQSLSKVFVILEHVSMKNNAKKPRWQVTIWWQKACFFHSTQLFWVSGCGYYNNWLHTVIPPVTTCKIFTRNNSSILKNHLRNLVWVFFWIYCSATKRNCKIDISVTFFWKISTSVGFFFHRK